MKYKFSDTDLTGFEEYDIKNDAYIKLMDKCFEYSTTLSLLFIGRNISLEEKMSQFEIEDLGLYRSLQVGHNKIKYFRTCPALKAIMLETTKSLFEWINGWGYHNPENPVFYRADNSLFFFSTIHEGECLLLPNDNEDVSEIIAMPGWEQTDDVTAYRMCARNIVFGG